MIYLFFISLDRGISSVQVGAFFSLSAFYLFSTHILRNTIKKYGWFNLNFGKLLFNSFLALLLLSVLNTIAQIIINLLFDILDTEVDFRPVVIAGNIFVSFLFYALWVMMYFLFHFLDNYNQSLKYQAKINEIQLNHLKSQLNPHFIFNALNSVRALVDEDPSKAKTAITQLSNILRFSLMMDKKRTIDFENEFNTVKDYLNLESIRFEERLDIKYSVDPTAYEYKVPPMMLQTIVENAIKHGISNRVKGGLIEIKCHEGIRDGLIIQVKNSGQLKANALSKKKDGEGHGISNTIQRLKLIYGSRASFKIFNSGNDFVITEIKIPKQNLTLG
ncbi:putative transmembrane sensor histidine kinase transcription regulator protein [Indibacter alkaliphilus LW1]|uniref:Transmembrane sensor histidine kinase transcription regulator protein n=1 Tax=Indibacter alkaliphilus (strain CCUG 57479 / KCTC 22604 / LW1) TaxID=1189612 RepID=S2E3D2_INDAL|nr:putative transmembrane sensor histidine kinase transcription regulator protein [Indibacter alkaliphilus LW1]